LVGAELAWIWGTDSCPLLDAREDRITEQLGGDKFTEHLHAAGFSLDTFVVNILASKIA